ncbi:MAG TPA: HipA N-terminal domain-containing protein [Ignavibacteriaceae bacterium]|jgi:serine/threonine-protein kinase HipA|nr:MAG: Serine/threonine-protein kinase HipA [Ignavibacteria bacterium ADurb.Bin266]OQY71803.1 MAG: phosphatidylinositol kinase [Ignavibacteriales bacterium UTCHB2]HQF41302.1 HipA N-terminal domain-containing protein [Ignavibacteriaceae bacterium]HQI41416.1 HipA N-terminal domain-containing protein [Ignavibacteriaceae bacterium]HQJ45012.1 HipA N-terminal domain-containing protein [Ignavibacteriaceae bacterium]
MRRGKVYYQDELAGIIQEDISGVLFTYDKNYLKKENTKPVSLTMPLREEPYTDKVMLPFFDNLIPEGWLLEIAEQNWKINPRDRMGLLLAFCKDTIGAVSIIKEDENE